MKTVKIPLFFSGIALLCFGITGISYGQATLWVDPVESVSPGVGSPLTIRLKIGNGRNVAGYEVSVNFDTSALRYVSSANGNYLPSGALFAPPKVSGGKVTLTATSVSGVAPGGSGTLASVTFRVVSVKRSRFRLTDVILSDSAARFLSARTRGGTVVGRGVSWDVNGDGRVNVLDLVRVVRSLGTNTVRADVNEDGRVNVLDLVTIAQYLGEAPVSTLPVPPQPVPFPEPPTVSPTEGMVLIPAGEFRMGSSSGPDNEKPVRSVYLDAFYMDKYEVTNAEYAAFLNAKGKHAEGGKTWLDIGAERCRIEYVSRMYRAKAGYGNHPVTYVSWYGAMAYAAWNRKRLPTEAEWEKAARGGLSGQKYPWGNRIDAMRANYGGHIGDTTAVGKYAPNGYGLYDMSGNVYEWCLDEYNSGFYRVSPSRNPLSGANSIQWLLANYTGVNSSRVLRGGSWLNFAPNVRVANRYNPTPADTYTDLGFRCVRNR